MLLLLLLLPSASRLGRRRLAAAHSSACVASSSIMRRISPSIHSRNLPCALILRRASDRDATANGAASRTGGNSTPAQRLFVASLAAALGEADAKTAIRGTIRRDAFDKAAQAERFHQRIQTHGHGHAATAAAARIAHRVQPP